MQGPSAHHAGGTGPAPPFAWSKKALKCLTHELTTADAYSTCAHSGSRTQPRRTDMLYVWACLRRAVRLLRISYIGAGAAL